MRNKDQIWAKRGQNRGLSLPHAYHFLVPKQVCQLTRWGREMPQIVTLLRQAMTTKLAIMVARKHNKGKKKFQNHMFRNVNHWAIVQE